MSNEPNIICAADDLARFDVLVDDTAILTAADRQGATSELLVYRLIAGGSAARWEWHQLPVPYPFDDAEAPSNEERTHYFSCGVDDTMNHLKAWISTDAVHDDFQRLDARYAEPICELLGLDPIDERDDAAWLLAIGARIMWMRNPLNRLDAPSSVPGAPGDNERTWWTEGRDATIAWLLEDSDLIAAALTERSEANR